MTNVIESVSSFLDKYNLKNQVLCLGFSGGYDSMCLLHVLHRLGCDVVAVHLNHNWRGEESRNEEFRCRNFCENLGVKFYSETLSADVPHTETAAREERYKFFKRAMQKFGAKDEHTEGICEVLRSLKPVEFAFVVKENGTNALKVSMRSKEKDVTQIVKKFGGGGHSRAAGCSIKKPLDEAIECILSEVKKYL